MGAGIAGSMLAGGAIGMLLLGPVAAGASSPATTPAGLQQAAFPTDVTGTVTPGVDHSNSDATHEAAETPTHEADETAGKVGPGGPGGPHMSNKDPAHEAAETPAQAAQEATRDAAVPNTPTATATG